MYRIDFACIKNGYFYKDSEICYKIKKLYEKVHHKY